MPNVEYSQSNTQRMGINGYPNGPAMQGAVALYCKGLKVELNNWKARLYDVLTSDENVNLTDEITRITSTVKELESIAAEMEQDCTTSLADQEKIIGAMLKDLRTNYTKAIQTLAPGWL